MKVLFYNSKDLISRLIEWGERSPWSHVAVVFGPDRLYEATWPQVRFLEGPEALRRMGEATHQIEVSGRTEDQGEDWCRSQVRDRYDLLALLGFAIGLWIGQKNRWICSSFVAEALVRSGALTTDDVYQETPETLAEHFGVVL